MTARKTATPVEHTDVPPALAAAPKPAPVGRFYELQQEVVPPTPYQLTEDIVIMPLTRRRNVALLEATTQEDQDRAILGDAYEAVVELYNDRPIQEFRAMADDLWKHWAGDTADQVPGK